MPVIPSTSTPAYAPTAVLRPRQVRHPFAVSRVLAPALAIVGVRQDTAWVEVDDEHLHVRFGPLAIRTPATSVHSVVSHGERQVAPRITATHHALHLVTNAGPRVVIELDGAVPGVAGWSAPRLRSITVTVERSGRLVHRLRQHIDARTFDPADPL